MNDNEREKFIKIEQVEKARKKFHKFIFTNFPLLYTFSSSGSGWTTFVRCEREREKKAKRRCFVGYLWRKLRIIMKNYALSSITLN